ncbi:MAG: CDP-2,3-bis-(O-geranylgeranyl)-sn-glycerol synthase [Methanomicrobiales archaeon]|nr:CDP-2,3-bis-(O-geranylgeranyl)-sn-glycerol synthase [Methanomicrobiales archaeon]
MLPSYVPNPAAVILGGGIPIDGGRLHADGNRLLGDGKTVRGLLLGILAGVLVGSVQILLQTQGLPEFLPRHTLLSVSLLATGALAGDLVKSYFKRRRGIPQGQKWPVADQYDFVAGALLLTLAGAPAWVLSNITIPIFLWILVLTPLLHRAVNLLGYSLGVKDVPW